MTLHRDVLKLEAQLLAQVSASSDAQQRAIIAAWVVAFDETSTELLAALDELTAANVNGTVTRAMILRSQRAQAAIAAIETALDQLADRTGVILTETLWADLSEYVAGQVGMIAAQLPPEVTAGATRAVTTSVVGASAEQIAAMVERVTRRMTSQVRELTVEAKRAIRRDLLRSISVGANPRVAARRAVAAVEGRFEGGIGRALNIARTEQIDAMREAARVVQGANADVLAGWTWVAHLGPRTCQACLAMHGSEHDLDEPGPLDHPGGRCGRVPRTKTWAELGFTGIRERKPAIQDAESFFNNLPETDQRAILGNRGYEAWKRGDYPMSAWSKRQQNTGWRDSFVPTVAPKK